MGGGFDGLHPCRSGLTSCEQSIVCKAEIGLSSASYLSGAIIIKMSATTLDNKYAARRMVHQHLQMRGIADRAVLDAMLAVPRHLFVSEDQQSHAYEDRALPTIDGQTISQPYIVAKMTELLTAFRGAHVLEVGTGSGYQSAVLASLDAQVTSIERHPALAQRARVPLEKLGLSDRVTVIVGDGTHGYAPRMPYDRIMVTAYAAHLSRPLRDQLIDGGRIVIPIGSSRAQHLMTFDRQGEKWIKYQHTACIFVPLVSV